MFHVLVQFEIHTIFENTAIIVQHRANPQMVDVVFVDVDVV
jgi:hypothetical protein